MLPVPCRNGGDPVPIDTHLLPEGTQPVAVQAVDGAYNTGRSAPVLARVDRTAPTRVDVALAGGEGWRRAPGALLQWANPAEHDRAPIDGAYYQTRREPGRWSQPHLVTGGNLAQVGLPVPVGQTQLRIWRRDSAGNSSSALASEPVTARYDPDPPRLAFGPVSAVDPTRLTVAVDERTSGVAGGSIEVSRQGSGTWQALAARRENGRLTADVDDSRLPAGTYVARAQASDLAGNVGVATRPGTLQLPLRIGSSLRAGVVNRKIVRRKVRRRGKRRTVKRRVIVLRPRARAHLGRNVKIAGRLTTPVGPPLGGQPVNVYSETPVSLPRLIGRVQTNRRGRFSYRAKATTTRGLTFAYTGTRLQLPAAARVDLLVPAASTIRASRRAVRNGASVLFRGRVRSTPLPPGGKLVELQAHFRGRWRTFQTVNASREGRWRFRYRFGGTIGRVRYRFRARLPAEGGYPFETGRSRVVSVTVRGR